MKIKLSWNCKEKPPKEVYKFIKERIKLRKQEKYNEADQIRKQIQSLGFDIDDGQEIIKIKKFGERY